MRLLVEYILSVVFPPRLPRINKTKEFDQWLRFEVSNHPKIDPFRPGENYSSAIQVGQHRRIPNYIREARRNGYAYSATAASTLVYK